jgi:hypothetical protein
MNILLGIFPLSGSWIQSHEPEGYCNSYFQLSTLFLQEKNQKIAFRPLQHHARSNTRNGKGYDRDLYQCVIEGQNFTFILEIITLSVHLLLPISRLLPFVIALEILSSLISKLEKPELFHFFLVLNLQHNACSFLVWRSL